MTKYHKLVAQNNRNLLSHSFRASKSKIRVSAGLIPSGGCEKEPVPCLTELLVVLLSVFGVAASPPSPSSSAHAVSLYAGLPPDCPLFIRTPVT